MPDFSRPPAGELDRSLRENYVGLHFEQGVPILDRDLNLLQDLVVASVRSILRGFVGNGVGADSSAFAVEAVPAANDVWLRAGPPDARSLLVDGIEVRLDDDVLFSTQRLPDDKALKAPDTGERVDVIYLDVDIETVEGLPELANPQDIGIQTSVRLRPRFRALVEPGATEPPPADPGHARYPLALIRRSAGVDVIRTDAITDLRQTRVNLAEVAARMATVEELRVRPRFDPAQPFTPTGSPVNKPVVLRGHNFDIPPVRVAFGGVLVEPDEVTATTVRVKVPGTLNGGPVKVTISTGGGSADAAMQFQVDGTTPKPIIDHLSRQSGDVGDEVIIFGQNFNTGGLVVKFGDIQVTSPQPKLNDDGTTITVKVPPGVTGPVDVSVTTIGSQGHPTVFTTKFQAGPTIAFTKQMEGGAQFRPRNGQVGKPVTLSGVNLDAVGRVELERTFPLPVTRVPVDPPLERTEGGTRLKFTLPSTTLAPGQKYLIHLMADGGVDVPSEDVLTIGEGA